LDSVTIGKGVPDESGNGNCGGERSLTTPSFNSPFISA
jgi:hypothetical protein